MKLTSKQEAFCQCIADGMTQADAYRTAYSASKMADKTIWVKASELMADGNVSVRVSELQAKLQAKQLWTREQSVNALADIVQGDSRAGEKVSAIKELNSMHGFNAPTKHEIDVTFPRVINVISGRA